MYVAESDCMIHGYIKKLGGPFASAWQTRYAKLYPNRLELHPESANTKPELIFLDQVLCLIPSNQLGLRVNTQSRQTSQQNVVGRKLDAGQMHLMLDDPYNI